ncbi:hypothetical protein [Streptomyces sp. GbtcB6]|uniref:hypothetical protein n=1 Tax=Streptomyces sp. GbtcB6 TaxID=2824751 RepID=UPI0020C66083|nr:hypothetical protein [Streptomyces sp. GbtcB6]
MHSVAIGLTSRPGGDFCTAVALAGCPRSLVAHEPATALDATGQREIVQLLRTIQRDTGMGLLMISHDRGYAGQVMEAGPTERVGPVSTPEDCRRFAARLVHGGEPDGERLLGACSLAFTATNHLPDSADLNSFAMYPVDEHRGRGFGLGLYVVTAVFRTEVATWGGLDCVQRPRLTAWVL